MYACFSYENAEVALNCGMMLRECFRHEDLAKLVLMSDSFYKFFDYVELSTFDIASDAFSTFKVQQTSWSACANGSYIWGPRFVGRLFNRVDLIKPVSNVRTCVRPSVRPSTKSSFNFNEIEIWHVGRVRCVMDDSMQYDLIQGQGHKPFKVGNLAVFNSYLRHLQCQWATDH